MGSLPRKTIIIHINSKRIAGGEQCVDTKIKFVTVYQEGLQIGMIFIKRKV